MLPVDDVSRYTLVRFLGENSDTAEAVQSKLDETIASEGLQINIVRMNSGREFDGRFHTFFSEREIKRETISTV